MAMAWRGKKSMQFFKTRKMVIVFLAVIMAGAISTAVFLKYNKGDGIVRASDGDNVHGFAWSELYGWFSFNSEDPVCASETNRVITNASCFDKVVGDVCGSGVDVGKCYKQNYSCTNDRRSMCDINGSGSTECNFGACNTTDPTNKFCTNNTTLPCSVNADCVGTCENNNYGTKIDVNTGNMNGYVWNPLLGYICLGDTCQIAEDVARNWKPSRDSVFLPNDADMKVAYTRGNEKLSGWANILSFKDDGWIKFDHGKAGEVQIGASTGVATGWAWNGNSDDSGAGWISFNSKDCDVDDNGIIDNGAVDNSNCKEGPTGRYAVTADVNLPPNLNTVGPNYNGDNDPCLDGNKVINPVFAWVFDDPGDFQSAFQLVVKNASNITVFDTGKVTSPTEQRKIDTTDLNYNTSYNYTLTVWDSGNPIKSTSVTGSFTTKANEYPDVSFTWYAPNPSAEEEIMFAGVSKYYTGGTASDCTDVKCDWGWTTTGTGDIINANKASSTIITFAEKNTDNKIEFTVTSNSVSCSTSTNMEIAERLPDWQERGNQ